MAMGASRRMRGGGKMTGAGGADLMKPGGGIRDLAKPDATKSAVKPSNGDSAEEAWIYVRGCRIERAGLRFNSHGEVYVPDSEDEEEAHEVAAKGTVSAELAPAMAADEAADVDLAPTAAADGASGVNLSAPAVAADWVPGVEMNPKVAARLAKKVLGEDLYPDVAVRLAVVLSEIEPFCHECFIDMYKVMVPLFFTPPP